MEDDILSDLKKNYIHMHLKNNKRMDGRKFKEYRNIEFTTNFVSTAEGSARVRLGGTDVVVGVKMEPGEPYPDAPDKGVMTTNAELVPMASPKFEPGPPNEDSIELARVVDRGIRESECIPLHELCIEPENKVWITFIDIHVLDYEGNLIDASSLGALLALMNTTVPASKYGLGDDYSLKIRHYPIACTAVKIGDYIMFDANRDEESVSDVRLTVTTDEDGNIRAMQKGFEGTLREDEVTQIINDSIELGKVLRKKIGVM